jgi:hypothetical protein
LVSVFAFLKDVGYFKMRHIAKHVIALRSFMQFLIVPNGPAVIISKRYSPPVKEAGVLLVKIVLVEKSGEYGTCFCRLLATEAFFDLRSISEEGSEGGQVQVLLNITSRRP